MEIIPPATLLSPQLTIQRLGASIDWSRDRFTHGRLGQAVNDVFIQLYDEGLIYRTTFG